MGVGLNELRKRAGRCFDRVAAGETIHVVRGGRLLAQIVSAGDSTVASNPADAAGPIGLDELRARTGRYLDRAAAGDELRSPVAAGWWRGSCRLLGARPGRPDRQVLRPTPPRSSCRESLRISRYVRANLTTNSILGQRN
jgi:antitoxin (DNA-binding transcriptional repressor) of toxin-antitoxin stability system